MKFRALKLVLLCCYLMPFALSAQTINLSEHKDSAILIIGDSYTSVNCLRCEIDTLHKLINYNIKIVELTTDGTSIIDYLKYSKINLDSVSINFDIQKILFQVSSDIYKPSGEENYIEALNAYRIIFPEAEFYLIAFDFPTSTYPLYSCQKNNITNISDCTIYKNKTDLVNKLIHFKNLVEKSKKMQFIDYSIEVEDLKTKYSQLSLRIDQYGHPSKMFQSIKAWIFIQEYSHALMNNSVQHYLGTQTQLDKFTIELLNN